MDALISVHHERTPVHLVYMHSLINGIEHKNHSIPHPTPMSTSERPGQHILEIEEVTTGASLSTGTSPTTERTKLLNPGIIRSQQESNPGPQVPLELLQPLGYRPS